MKKGQCYKFRYTDDDDSGALQGSYEVRIKSTGQVLFNDDESSGIWLQTSPTGSPYITNVHEFCLDENGDLHPFSSVIK